MKRGFSLVLWVCLGVIWGWAQEDARSLDFRAVAQAKALGAWTQTAPASTLQRVAEQDSSALVALYQATGGDQWRYNWNWLSDQPVSTWYGVTVADGRVRSLALTDAQFAPGSSLPAEVGNLSELVWLDLRHNNIAGRLPEEIGQLTQLQGLDLEGNQFNVLPAEISQLKQLVWLYLNGNAFQQLPAEIGDLEALEVLVLDQNAVTRIPEEIGELAALGWLYLGNNQLKEIPETIADLPQLKWLDLSKNQLSALPDLSGLSSLRRLYVQRNQFVFDDLEPLADQASQFDEWHYAPQANLGLAHRMRGKLGHRVVFNGETGGSENVYQWWKNGEAVLENGDQFALEIPQGTAHDAGSYLVEITNPKLPDLTLCTKPVDLWIYPAIGLSAEPLATQMGNFEERQATLEIHNTDNFDMVFSFQFSAGWLAVDRVLGTVPAGTHTTVNLTMRALDLPWASYSDEVAITFSEATAGKNQAAVLGELKVPVSMEVTEVVSTEDNELPDQFALLQNYPNPFNPATTIRYALPESAHARLTVFDALGRAVAVLVDGQQPVGWHTVSFDAGDLPSGIYLYRLTAGSFTQTKKFLLSK